MSYKRKTRPKWISDVFIILSLVVGTLLGSGFVRAETWYKAFAKEQYINPLSETDIRYVEVPTTVIKTEVPTKVEDIICAVFTENCEEALKVARCESGLRPNAQNGSSSARGLFQVLSYTHGIREDWLFNPIINTLAAKKLYDNRGGTWGAWEASKGCHGLN